MIHLTNGLSSVVFIYIPRNGSVGLEQAKTPRAVNSSNLGVSITSRSIRVGVIIGRVVVSTPIGNPFPPLTAVSTLWSRHASGEFLHALDSLWGKFSDTRMTLVRWPLVVSPPTADQQRRSEARMGNA